MFFHYWFPRKAMWCSESQIKSTAASLKKFYSYMSEIGEITADDLQEMKETIKEDMDEWLDAYRAEYDDFDDDFDDDFFGDDFGPGVAIAPPADQEFEVPEVPLAKWERAYDLADKIAELKHWKKWNDLDFFGFTNPQTGETGFITFHGKAGQHFAVVVYPDAQAFHRLNMMVHSVETTPFDLCLVEQLQLTFENRDGLLEGGLETIMSLGRKYKGKHAWPQFVSYVPSFGPWHMDEEQLDLITHALEIVQAHLPKIKYNVKDLDRAFAQGKVCFLDEEGYPFNNIPMQIEVEQFLPNAQTLKEAGSWNRVNNELEVVRRVMDNPIGNAHRPYFSNLLMVVERQSGQIIGFELLSPIPDYRNVVASTPGCLLSIFEQQEILPSAITVSDPWLEEELGLMCDRLSIQCKCGPTPQANAAFEEMTAYMNKQMPF